MFNFVRGLMNWFKSLFASSVKEGESRKRMYNTGIGNISYSFNCRSNQSKRRKMQRRAA